jgi:hypothetical protein
MGLVGYRSHTSIRWWPDVRRCIKQQERQRYAEQTAVLVRPNQGRAFFGSFCGSIDGATVRIGTAIAFSAFHKPDEFRFFCNDNGLSSDCGGILLTNPSSEHRLDDDKLGKYTNQLHKRSRAILLFFQGDCPKSQSQVLSGGWNTTFWSLTHCLNFGLPNIHGQSFAGSVLICSRSAGL